MVLPWSRPWAAVHRGRRHVPGCPEAAAALVRAAGLDVRYVGEGERLSLSGALDRGPAVLVHPGGGELEQVWEEVGQDRQAVRDYVAGGGGYLGLCLGGYLAGRTPGYGLLPGDTDQLVVRSGSPVVDPEGEVVIQVLWDGVPRRVYAQDPPVFLLDPGVDGGAGTRVVATYPQGDVAALVCRFGGGRVAVCGPHPEATADWFTDAGLPVQETHDLALGLLSRLGPARSWGGRAG